MSARLRPDWLAGLHHQCFTVPRPWSAAEFAGLLQNPAHILETAPQGFVLARVAGDEAEILTIAVAPAARRRGVGSALLRLIEATAQARGAGTLLLEVAQNNAAALAFYRAHHFEPRAQRPAYYRVSGQNSIDALIMARSLT